MSATAPNAKLFCSFCGCAADRFEKLIVVSEPSRAAICSRCVDRCNGALADRAALPGTTIAMEPAAGLDIRDIHDAEDRCAELQTALRHASRTTAPNVLLAELRIARKAAKNLEFQIARMLEPEPRAPVGTAVRPEARRPVREAV